MRNWYRKAVLLFLLSITTMLSAQNLSQYGIQGWAATTVGGRGGTVLRVTNLHASGAGSLADALSKNYPRLIVFEVSGVIDLDSTNLYIRKPYVTVAGQTAPGKGITLINGGLSIQSHDVVLQHLRIRPGASGHVEGWEPDALTTVNAYNVVIDHCSLSWAVDENCSASGDRFNGATPDEWRANTSHDVTFSNNIIAEGLSTATHSKGEHSKGSLIHDNVTNMAVLRNLYANNQDRNPLFKGGARGVVVNNFINNPGVNAISYYLSETEWEGYEQQTGQMSVVGNYLQTGPSSSSSVMLMKVSNGACEVYMADNVSAKETGVVYNEYKGDETYLVDEKPVWHDNIQLLPAAELPSYLFAEAGARPWDRDSIDWRILQEMQADTGKIIDYETEVEGYPSYASDTADFIEEDWDLDYMLKLTHDVSIVSPLNGTEFEVDSTFEVEAEVCWANDSLLSLELLANGVSQGKVYAAPYQWEISMDEDGDYDLVVVAHKMHTVPQVSSAVSIAISENLSSFNENTAACSGLQLYPNPFSGETRIRFVLAQKQQVDLQLYNSAGQWVQTVLSAQLESGEQEVLWRPTNLRRGLYFGCLLLGSERQYFKLVYE